MDAFNYRDGQLFAEGVALSASFAKKASFEQDHWQLGEVATTR